MSHAEEDEPRATATGAAALQIVFAGLLALASWWIDRPFRDGRTDRVVGFLACLTLVFTAIAYLAGWRWARIFQAGLFALMTAGLAGVLLLDLFDAPFAAAAVALLAFGSARVAFAYTRLDAGR